MATKYVFIYCRISQDQQGRAEGVEAQEKWGREYATQHWPGITVRVFADNDISAAKEDVVRPEFERMREAIRAGECAHLWAVEQSRLTRIEHIWFNLVTDLLKAGVDELHTKRDGIRRLDDIVGGIMAVIDAAEVRKLKKRINDKLGELATQGRPPGGRSYGYRSGRDAEGRKTWEIQQDEAEVIRWAAERVLSGWSLTGITRTLDDQGVRGCQGGRMRGTNLKGTLLKPSIAGLRVYGGEVVGKATWEPILDEATWRSVCAALRNRTTVTGSDGRKRRAAKPSSTGGRRWLLTGLTTCVCGARMTPSKIKPTAKRERAAYRCLKIPHDGCGRMHIPAAQLEDHVIVSLFDHLDDPVFLAAFSSDEHAERRDELTAELSSIDQQRVEASEMWTARQITSQQFATMNDGLAAEAARIESELDDLPTPITRVDPAKLRATWSLMTLDEQRKIIFDWVDSIVIHEMNGNGPPTRRMVAERVGVGKELVSYAFHSPPEKQQISEETRRRVFEAADAIGYRPGARSAGWTFDPERVEITWRTSQ